MCEKELGSDAGPDARFHPECMTCSNERCGVKLDPTGFFLLDNNGYCAAHLPAELPSCSVQEFDKETISLLAAHGEAGLICRVCEKPVDLASGLEAMHGWFHSDCFRCSQCSEIIEAGFVEIDGKPVCPTHVEAG